MCQVTVGKTEPLYQLPAERRQQGVAHRGVLSRELLKRRQPQFETVHAALSDDSGGAGLLIQQRHLAEHGAGAEPAKTAGVCRVGGMNPERNPAAGQKINPVDRVVLGENLLPVLVADRRQKGRQYLPVLGRQRCQHVDFFGA